MEWETDICRIKLCPCISNINLGRNVVQSLKDTKANLILCSDTSNDKENYLENRNICKMNIPYCELYPKFLYIPHLWKIKSHNKDLDRDIHYNISKIVILFVTIQIYDQISNLNTNHNIKSSKFGHPVVDCVYEEIQLHMSSNYKVDSQDQTRCIVIWIGIRDCLSQEALLRESSNHLANFQNNDSLNFSGQTSLDMAITYLLIHLSSDSIEVRNEADVTVYLYSIISSIGEAQKRPVPSKYKPKSNNSTAADSIWVSQLIQIPGLSDESAKAIADKFPNPSKLIQFINEDGNDFQNLSNKRKHIDNIFEIMGSKKSCHKEPEWLITLANLTYLSSNGIGLRKLGRSRAKKLAIMYSRNALPDDILSNNTKNSH
ncbi:uncharacterized protein CMU_008250 [Cryptosporidium muris RN66]|uniref:ERCC4 domain-containing protein n=1 Tax=Cryptosporidium muris (strain RN66) TaxID=441375 RepID=B6ADP3_CRYMR|nr:uncharacterized protein CMU_008250 [Cryptosporidium muris RN66]EEA06334.1 hypothetical protein, conserved [Cryptosporidium muris RN66]|eukprot:XP_002140683.1 hypothetical protein [Cryptosporidium muris RN66]